MRIVNLSGHLTLFTDRGAVDVAGSLTSHQDPRTFPDRRRPVKVLYLACREMGRTSRAGQGGRSSYNWKAALNQFDIIFPRPPRPGLTSTPGQALTQKR
jgi:hypothetical protein